MKTVETFVVVGNVMTPHDALQKAVALAVLGAVIFLGREGWLYLVEKKPVIVFWIRTQFQWIKESFRPRR
jgi:hypothetical protein